MDSVVFSSEINERDSRQDFHISISQKALVRVELNPLERALMGMANMTVGDNLTMLDTLVRAIERQEALER